MIFKTFAFAFAISSVFGSCDYSKCDPFPKHYEELGCKPILIDGECCPKSFDCKHLETRDQKQCYLKNSTLKVGDAVESSLLSGTCVGTCHCDADNFNCALMSCADSYGPRLEPGCVRQYANDKCCSTGVVCGEEAKKLASCDFEGKTYQEGERMQPQDFKCHRCVCTRDFEKKPVPENKDCIKHSCNIELFELGSVKDGCVPSYHIDSCCPYTWRCPSSSDAIVPANQKLEQQANSPKCKFGSLILEVGDSLSKDENGCAKCTCKTPPMVDCLFSGC